MSLQLLHAMGCEKTSQFFQLLLFPFVLVSALYKVGSASVWLFLFPFSQALGPPLVRKMTFLGFAVNTVEILGSPGIGVVAEHPCGDQTLSGKMN